MGNLQEKLLQQYQEAGRLAGFTEPSNESMLNDVLETFDHVEIIKELLESDVDNWKVIKSFYRDGLEAE